MSDHPSALANALERLIHFVEAGGKVSTPAGTEDALLHAQAVLAAWKNSADPLAKGNALFTIVVENRNGSWVFDDPARALVAEPFVCGADVAFAQMSAQAGGAKRLTTVFSARSFPGATLTLHRLRFEAGGAWYRIDPLGIDGWLCPAVLRYFPAHPSVIHASVAPTTGS